MVEHAVRRGALFSGFFSGGMNSGDDLIGGSKERARSLGGSIVCGKGADDG